MKQYMMVLKEQDLQTICKAFPWINLIEVVGMPDASKNWNIICTPAEHVYDKIQELQNVNPEAPLPESNQLTEQKPNL